MLTESMPLATTLVPENFVMTVSTDASHSRGVYCRGTQVGVTTSATGTQCALVFRNSTSSQTQAEFPVLDVNDAAACASGKFSASQDVANIAAKRGLVCSYRTHSGNTRCSSGDSLVIQIDGKLPCLSCQPCNHQTTHLEGCTRKTPRIGTACKKAFHGYTPAACCNFR
ncbi:uncharacterized protein LOC144158689 isoform X2 [Haemaphysalis longicornis]